MRWYRRWRRQRACFHHDRSTGTSWIKSQLINMGSGKLFWCDTEQGGCDRTWTA